MEVQNIKTKSSKPKFEKVSAQELSDKILHRSKNKKVVENNTEDNKKFLNKKRFNSQQKQSSSQSNTKACNKNESSDNESDTSLIKTRTTKYSGILGKLENTINKQKVSLNQLILY